MSEENKRKSEEALERIRAKKFEKLVEENNQLRIEYLKKQNGTEIRRAV